MKLNTIEYNGKKYPLVFNLNVMEAIQEEYGTVNKWAELTSGDEPKAKAVIFGFCAMLNEGIDIWNDENEEKIEKVTLKQVGRMITEVGINGATSVMQNTVIDATASDEKNV